MTMIGAVVLGLAMASTPSASPFRLDLDPPPEEDTSRVVLLGWPRRETPPGAWWRVPAQLGAGALLTIGGTAPLYLSDLLLPCHDEDLCLSVAQHLVPLITMPLAASLGVWLAGEQGGGEGRYLPTVLGAFVGSVGLAMLWFGANQFFIGALLPVTFAYLAYELSHRRATLGPGEVEVSSATGSLPWWHGLTGSPRAPNEGHWFVRLSSGWLASVATGGVALLGAALVRPGSHNPLLIGAGLFLGATLGVGLGGNGHLLATAAGAAIGAGITVAVLSAPSSFGVQFAAAHAPVAGALVGYEVARMLSAPRRDPLRSVVFAPFATPGGGGVSVAGQF